MVMPFIGAMEIPSCKEEKTLTKTIWMAIMMQTQSFVPWALGVKKRGANPDINSGTFTPIRFLLKIGPTN